MYLCTYYTYKHLLRHMIQRTIQTIYLIHHGHICALMSVKFKQNCKCTIKFM